MAAVPEMAGASLRETMAQPQRNRRLLQALLGIQRRPLVPNGGRKYVRHHCQTSPAPGRRQRNRQVPTRWPHLLQDGRGGRRNRVSPPVPVGPLPGVAVPVKGGGNVRGRRVHCGAFVTWKALNLIEILNPASFAGGRLPVMGSNAIKSGERRTQYAMAEFPTLSTSWRECRQA